VGSREVNEYRSKVGTMRALGIEFNGSWELTSPGGAPSTNADAMEASDGAILLQLVSLMPLVEVGRE
jgi:hypothetical protein